jgi:hypothetical protein
MAHDEVEVGLEDTVAALGFFLLGLTLVETLQVLGMYSFDIEFHSDISFPLFYGNDI